MPITYSINPYYDDYDPEKDYTQIIALPGRAEQAREFTQAQTIQRDFTERLGKAIFSEGAIISGCELIIDRNNATIREGKIFLDGLVRNVRETTLSISKSGIERIVVVLNTTLVTELDDETLRDPAQGYENFGSVGAYRQKQSLEFHVLAEGDNSLAGVTLYTLKDGEEIKTTDNASESNMFEDKLAERTYDENGNFKIKGLDIQNEVTYNRNSDKIIAHVNAGKAYVHGYQIDKNYVSNVPLNPSRELRTVSGESHVYSNTLTKYELSNFPVSEIINITCSIKVTEPAKNRGSIRGGYDALTYTPVQEIVSITQGGTTYTKNRDYKLYADQVDWSLSGDGVKEPAVGTAYSVTYIYNKSMVKGRDYNIVNEKGKSYLVFLSSGDKPIDNTVFYVYYKYTLARRDLLLMDALGNITAIEGAPDKFDKLITPYNQDRERLNLGYIDIQPMYEGIKDYASITNYQSVRLTQANLYTMLKRIDNLEMNMASLDLDRDAENKESADTLNCIYTDSFTDLTKSDINYATSSAKFDCCIDYARQELTIPADIADAIVPMDTNNSSYGILGDVISAPFEYQIALEQNNITGVMKVNPYDSFNALSVVNLSPSEDKWVDTKTIKVYDTVDKTNYTTTTRTYSHGWWSVNATHNLRGYRGQTINETTSYVGTTTSEAVTSNVASTVIEYMRQREVDVIGKAFDNGLTNIKCIFNGTEIPLTATDGTVQSSAGKVQADGNGNFTAKFTVPANTPCGTVKVEFVGTNAMGTEFKGTTFYSAEGTLLTTTITNTTTITRNYNVLKEIHNLYNSDPLAQSFLFNTDTVIAKIGLYFSTKDATRPCVVQVRNMVNGYPGETVYAEVTLEAKDIRTSSDGSLVTEVRLNQPVYCYADTAYCFVVLSDCQSYTLYYAELGKTLYNNPNAYMTVNPYPTGVLFSSSNATTWTAHQSADLKFKLYRTRYTGTGEINFHEVKLDSPAITGLVLDASYADFRNAGITWMYRISNTGTWLPIDSLVYRDLQGTTDTIQLKAKLDVKYNTSPFVSASQVALKYFMDAKKATYISKSLSANDFEHKYQALKVTYQLALPSGASCNVYYMDKEGGAWTKLDASDEFTTLTTKMLDEEFYQYTWDVSKIKCIKDNGSCGGSTFYKIRIDLETPVVYNRPRVKKLVSIMKFNDEYSNEFD